MEDQAQTQTPTPTPTSPRTQCLERNHHEPVRSRWTPKPEQILILESIFNSGMVNPPKDETVKIRKLLEKFGSVGDANVFYWFQNRRSRSRRRQRQIQASLVSSEQQQSSMVTRCVSGGGGGGVGGGDGCSGGAGAIQYQDAAYTTATQGFVMQQPSFFPMLQSLAAGSSSSSFSSTCSRLGGADEIYPISSQAVSFQEIEQNPSSMASSFQHLDTSKVHYEFGVITVFINGVPTEVESGPFNMKALFGEDLMLIHSSGVPVPLGEYGVCTGGLQHGESYFLVSKFC